MRLIYYIPWITFWLLVNFLLPSALLSQCQTPFGVSFTLKTKNFIEFRWTDPNQQPLGWDVEIVTKGSPATGVPTNLQPLTDNRYRAEGLNPSTFYEIYIRTICSQDQKSNWNGPFVVSTVLENPTQCQVDLDLKDNGTETFLIEIDQEGLLGQTIFLSSIELICEHDWPADVRITLFSPSGNSVILTNYHGTGNKHFGIIDDENCFLTTKFSDQACVSFQQSKPPFVGSFIPYENLQKLHDHTSSKGIWRLVFHDRAAFHRGNLKYLKINLDTENCLIPLNFFVPDINSTSAKVIWDAPPFCQSVKITVKEKDKPADQEKVYFLNCLDGQFNIPDLLPETEYEIVIQSVCGITVSQISCKQYFTTKCKPVTLSESFDTKNNCTEGCQFECNISGTWFNVSSNNQDWIVWDGNTDTENTGPMDDITGAGKYIYMESQPDQCGFGTETILQSNCIHVISNSDACDFSFHYHMYGQGIGILRLEISTDNGDNWTELWQIKGDQGDEWQRVLISLEEFDGSDAIFRYVAISKNDIFGDIAIDQLEFYGSTLNSTPSSYYKDQDEDGYGNAQEVIFICQSSPPIGYVINALDCNDENPNIHPGETEILCNVIDENCNGMEDDIDITSTLDYAYEIIHESCNGEKNGKIDLDIMGGQPPYFVHWNLGSNMEDLIDIGHGIYYATISDASGCAIRTDFLEVNALQSIQYLVTGTERPSCLGKMDGQIFVNHSGGEGPFTYQWSNGSSGKDLNFVGEGSYFVTITDKNGCSAESQEILLLALPGMSVGATFLKHPTCADRNDGEIHLGVVNGTPPYSYQWEDGQTTPTIHQLNKGFYYSTVTDIAGCIGYFQIELVSPDTLVPLLVNVESVRCFGEKNGIIKTNTHGGTPPYIYFWSFSGFEDDVFDVKAGIYSLTVTDQKGCTAELLNVEVKEPPPLVSSIEEILPSRCLLGETGKISLSTEGGTPPYHYSWNSFSFADTSSLENLQNGVYSAIIFDKNGCKFNLGSILVPYENVPLDIQTMVLDSNQCFEDKKGVITARVTQGITPFDFNWSHGVQRIIGTSTDTVLLLGAGTYNVTVTDNEGCIGISNFASLPFIPKITYQIINITSNHCALDSTAMLQVLVKNAQGHPTVEWNTGKEGLVLTGLPNGTYFGTIRDSVGCILNTEFIKITSLSNLEINTFIQHSEPGKNNGSVCVSVSGEVPPYQITWDTSMIDLGFNCANSLSAGTYQITVTDQLLCSETVTIIIEERVNSVELSEQQIFFFPNPTLGELFCSIDLQDYNINLTNAAGILQYFKNQGEKFNSLDVSKLPAGIYFIKVEKHGKMWVQKIIKI